ncbi:hypothetical protein OG976_23330 [Mycobacterium sp. NBC_00419]
MVIARAGEGTISEIVGHPQWVAKVFHDDLKDRALKCAKVAAMVDSPPSGAVQSDGFAVLTWPLHTLVGPTGPVGYVMHRIDTANAVEIHTISNPSNRAKPLPAAPQWTPHVTWLHLVNVAANLCLAVEVVHRVDAVIGDFQERNILVNDTTRVTLVDCDSMQFTDTTGHQYLCGVGRPEFTAPELAGLNLATTARHKPSDLFALAVHIHLLLMAGNHPFLRGTWTGHGEQPDAMSLAKSGWWAGGPGSPLHTHPVAPPPQFLPDNIQRLFHRAFTTGAHDPATRPTAHEWRTALQGLQIRTCPHGHQVPVETEQCPWCHIDTQRTARKTQHTYTTTPQPNQTVYPIPTPHTPSTPPTTTTTTTTPRNTTKYILAGAAILAILITTIALTTNRTTTTTTATTIITATATATATAVVTATPTTTTPPLNESTAFDRLREIADNDRSFVAANLADRWVPQLSSKRPGVVDQGVTWNNVLTLQEHMRLRQQYDAKLLWSGNWSTFDDPDWWVTVAGVTFPDAGGALAWCRDHGYDRNHCYAKLVSTSHPIDGSSAFNN